MRRVVNLLILLLLFNGALCADQGQCLQASVEESNNLYRTGAGCEDGIFNAISTSMLGWGVGLFMGIALLTGLVHNAHQDTTSSSNNSNN